MLPKGTSTESSNHGKVRIMASLANYPISPGNTLTVIIGVHEKKHHTEWLTGQATVINVVAGRAGGNTIASPLVGQPIASLTLSVSLPATESYNVSVKGQPQYTILESPPVATNVIALSLTMYALEDGQSCTLHVQPHQRNNDESSSITGLCRVVRADPLGFALLNRSAIVQYASAHGDKLDLLHRFTTTDDGEELMSPGASIPFLGIHAWSYRAALLDNVVNNDALAILGRCTVSEKYYRIGSREATSQLIVVKGETLKCWPPETTELNFGTVRIGIYRFRGFAVGGHGDDWLPSIVGERINNSEQELSDPWINLDPTEAWG